MEPEMERGGLGLVLSGGGARGIFQVGVYEELLKHPALREPAVLSGSSAGAINAAFIAAGRTPKDMKDFWLSLASDAPEPDRRLLAKVRALLFGRGGPTPPVEANQALFDGLYDEGSKLFGAELRALLLELGVDDVLWPIARDREVRGGRALAGLVTHLLTTGFGQVKRLLDNVPGTHLFGTRRLRERLREWLPDPVVPREGVALAVSAVDVHRGVVIRYVSTDSEYTVGEHYQVLRDGIPHDVILASAAIPLLLEPQWVDELSTVGRRLLWDGGLLVNTPLAPAVDLLAERILPVLATRGPMKDATELATLHDTVERLADCFLENTYNVDRKLLLTRNLLADAEGCAGREPSYFKARLFKPIRVPPDVSVPQGPFTAGSYLDFHRAALEKMYGVGAGAVGAWLRETGTFEDRLDVAPRPFPAPGPV